ncbi:MAG TPA: SsrA-binding protein [Acidimicrobiaceae bacterium]|nr:SsrA-binding protein [Acidimicrobiaceae bacterium]HCB37228.1 SsrA-binding protein [Acidimicrobiaceae bacterium]
MAPGPADGAGGQRRVARTGSADSHPDDRDVVARNRRARAAYEILDRFECGLVLAGSEVKSLRAHTVQMTNAYARVRDDEMWLMGLRVAPWSHAAAGDAYDPDRPRKLLMRRAQIDRLRARTEQDRLQLIPLSVYFVDGIAKVELALARSRRLYDKRQALRKRESDREAERALRYRRR